HHGADSRACGVDKVEEHRTRVLQLDAEVNRCSVTAHKCDWRHLVGPYGALDVAILVVVVIAVAVGDTYPQPEQHRQRNGHGTETSGHWLISSGPDGCSEGPTGHLFDPQREYHHTNQALLPCTKPIGRRCDTITYSNQIKSAAILHTAHLPLEGTS